MDRSVISIDPGGSTVDHVVVCGELDPGGSDRILASLQNQDGVVVSGAITLPASVLGFLVGMLQGAIAGGEVGRAIVGDDFKKKRVVQPKVTPHPFQDEFWNVTQHFAGSCPVSGCYPAKVWIVYLSLRYFTICLIIIL